MFYKLKSLNRNDERVVPEGVERSQILSQDQLLIKSGLVHKLTPEQEEEAWVVFICYTGKRTETYEELSQRDFELKQKKRRLIATIAAVVSAVIAVLTYLGI